MAETPSPGVCRNGHPRTPENTYVDGSGRRHCRRCRQEAQRRYEASPHGREYMCAWQRQKFHDDMLTPEGRWKRRRWHITKDIRARARKAAQQPAPVKISVAFIDQIIREEIRG